MDKNNEFALEVRGLTKRYERFTLDNVNFAVQKGNITGLIGRNGAGKSTTLKGILNLIDAQGEVFYFGKDFKANERDVKQLIGFVSGGFDFYRQKTLMAVAKTVSSFYANWDEEQYKKYLAKFALDDRKKVRELSAGMKVKFSIALALSHGAKILILDEPTSGLDPLSREEVCDILLAVKEEGKTILFSTHITSDLMRVADDVIYISGGRVLMQERLDVLVKKYSVVDFAGEPDKSIASDLQLIGLKRVKNGFAALVESETWQENASKYYLGESEVRSETLDDIMIHFEKEGEKDD